MGPLRRYMTDDHQRLDALLDRATADAGHFDAEAFERFRAGLLRHIGIEEKILLRDARQRRGGEPLPVAARLRVEHAAIASLLVPTPDAALAGEIRQLLEAHNVLEEADGGLY
ncbi:MAG: hemerythrin domain-containing protein, partial [Polyangia bacterium]